MLINQLSKHPKQTSYSLSCQPFPFLADDEVTCFRDLCYTDIMHHTVGPTGPLLPTATPGQLSTTFFGVPAWSPFPLPSLKTLTCRMLPNYFWCELQASFGKQEFCCPALFHQMQLFMILCEVLLYLDKYKWPILQVCVGCGYKSGVTGNCGMLDQERPVQLLSFRHLNTSKATSISNIPILW